MKIVKYTYKVGDKIMLINKEAYKLKTLYKGPYEIIKMWTNGMVTIQMEAMADRLNVHQIKTCKYEEYSRQYHISSAIYIVPTHPVTYTLHC